MRHLHPIMLLLFLALMLTGCSGEKESGRQEPSPPESGGAAGSGGVGSDDSSGERASGVAAEEPAGSGPGGGKSAGAVPVAPVELPLELLDGFPEEPNWARDGRIGALQTSRLAGDPQAVRATDGARDFLESVLAGEEVGESFHDAITAEQLLATLQAECDGFRVGVAQRLPQAEWAVPFRCLLRGEPMPLSGTLYVDLDGRPAVVDGSVEYLPEVERIEPEAAREETTPF